jgi:hypothetical protein
MQTIYLTGNEPMIQDIARATFPEYKGHKFQLAITDRPMNLASYWEGGSRSYYKVVNLATMQASAAVPAQSAFDKPIAGIEAVPIPEGGAIVEHCIFCGKDMGLRIHIGPSNAAPMLPAKVELTAHEKIVLNATGLKSSYAGIKDYRFYDANRSTGITRTEYDAAKSSLQARGLLDKRGAITVTGSNAR